MAWAEAWAEGFGHTLDRRGHGLVGGWQGPDGGRLAQAAGLRVASLGSEVALGASSGWKLVRGHCGVTSECSPGGLS